MKKPALIALVSIIALCLILGVSAILWPFQSPVPMKRLKQIEKGMTKEEIETILGPPSKKYPGSDGIWEYDRPRVFGYVQIDWQDDGTYDGDYNYERF